jgi:molybdopterin synthase sulfur carrier subunit
MIQLSFGNALQRHVDAPPLAVEASTVAEALEHAFARQPRLRGYLLDDQGALRKHMALFVNGTPISDRKTFRDPLPDGSEVMVIQALSGG